jgi:hypothetical protein
MSRNSLDWPHVNLGSHIAFDHTDDYLENQYPDSLLGNVAEKQEELHKHEPDLDDLRMQSEFTFDINVQERKHSVEEPPQLSDDIIKNEDSQGSHETSATDEETSSGDRDSQDCSRSSSDDTEMKTHATTEFGNPIANEQNINEALCHDQQRLLQLLALTDSQLFHQKTAEDYEILRYHQLQAWFPRCMNELYLRKGGNDYKGKSNEYTCKMNDQRRSHDGSEDGDLEHRFV